MGIKGKNDRMVVLACEDCKERNYTTVKNKKNTKEPTIVNKADNKKSNNIIQTRNNTNNEGHIIDTSQDRSNIDRHASLGSSVNEENSFAVINNDDKYLSKDIYSLTSKYLAFSLVIKVCNLTFKVTESP